VKRLHKYLRVRCPSGLAPSGSASEREPLLVALHRHENQRATWEPAMRTVSIWKRIGELGKAAAERVAAQIEREPSLARIGELMQR